MVSDETYYGGAPKNRHGHKSGKGGQGQSDKTPIVALVSRETGEVRSRVVSTVNGENLLRILANAPAKYGKAFLHTETDDRDTTYFIVYQLDVIQRAVTELHAYLDRKVKEVRDVERLMRAETAEFNHRQLALLGHAIRNPGQAYTFQSHSSSHDVTHETARNDLIPLLEKGLLERSRVGRRYMFTAHSKLAERLERASSAAR